MISRRLVVSAAGILVALALFVFLPSSNVLLLAQPAFVAHEYQQPWVPPADRYDSATRLQLAQETVRWLTSGEDIAALRSLSHDGQAVYNERELKHMADVKVVLNGLRWVWCLAGVILLGALGVAIGQPVFRRPFAAGMFWGSALLVAALAGIVIGAILNFDAFFVLFHRVFFSGDSWLFAYEDSLIQFYPVEFWMDATWILGGATLLEGLLVGGLTFLYRARTRGKR